MNKLRIKESALEEKDGKYYYKDKLFTGVKYSEEGDWISAKDVIDGKVIGDYHNEYLTVADKTTDKKTVLRQGPQAKYKGTPLNGLVYNFANEFCHKETLYVDGYALISVFWYPSGSMRRFWQMTTEGGAQINFYANGKLQSAYISKGKDINARIDMTEQGTATLISMTRNFLSTHNEFVSGLPFQVAENKEEFLHYEMDKDSFLWGEGIQDVLDDMIARACFANTTYLRTQQLNLTKEQINYFGSLPQMTRLIVSDTSGRIAGEIKKIKKNRPEMVVEYEFILE